MSRQSLDEILADLESFKDHKNAAALSSDALLTLLLHLIQGLTAHLTLDQTRELLAEMSSWEIFDDLALVCGPLHQEYPFAHLLLLTTLGPLIPNIYRKMEGGLEHVADIINQPWPTDGDSKPLRLLALELATQLCRVQELAISELDMVSLDAMQGLLNKVHDLYHEEETIAVILRFLLSLHGQFCKKQGAIRSRLVGLLLQDSLLGMRKEISLGIVFLYNRADDLYLQESIVDLLNQLYAKCPDFFYTNDSTVIFDITLRQVMRVGDEQELIRHSMIKLLPLILASVPVASPGGTFNVLQDQMRSKLEGIASNPGSKGSTKMLAQRTLLQLKK
ncbi:hypothetical protein HDU91_003879 [Kappamyces sp. JEL0680]|nr:hypothetical protein HDU91_003879 [Kappamyces sp. JEL0680]